MKASILLFIGIFCIINVFAQSPQAFNYQAVVRNSTGTVLQNQTVSLQISILKDSVTGASVFIENHFVITNNFGLVNLKIGKGTVVSGNFTTIDWSTGLFFIKIEMDATGGSAFVEMGVSQLLSVPFALYAASGNQGPQGIQGISGTNGLNGISVIWLGSFTSNPLNPLINQAYYNLTDKKSYIFDGTVWQIIAQDGMQGLQGIQGLSGSNGQNGISVLWIGTFNLHPSTPALNQAYYNSTDKKSYIFDGVDWQILAQDGAQGQAGNDGQNGISVSWLGTFAGNPNNPALNQAYYNSTDKKSYIFDGIDWQIIAQDGMQGLQGIQGTQGLQGPAGTYIAGAGITISNDTISSFIPAYNAGAGLSLTGTTFNAIFGSTTGTISEGNHTHISYTAGGVNGNLQFNDSGVFGGNNALFWDNNNLRLGIGTSLPTSTLHINGTLRITDDTEGAGKILTSDTNGYTSWQLPSSGMFTGTQNRIAKFTSPNSIGNSLFYESGNYIGLGTTNPVGRLVVKGDSLSNDSIPLLEVQDKNGNTVFVVWPNGARFYVDSAGTAKTNNRGSFAISGKSNSKSIINEYFSVNSDSISATKSLYIPRLTTLERDNLGFTPSDALIIFNTTDECMEIFKNGVWSNIWCFQCAPNIIIQPFDATICNGQDTGFTISATGTSISYQWQVSIDGGTSWINISDGGSSPVYSGTTSWSLILTNLSVNHNGYKYRCKVVSSCPPELYSNIVTLNIGEPTLTITSQPSNQTLVSGCNGSISISTSAYGLYQWQQSNDGGSSWNNISNGSTYNGVTTANLSLLNVSLSLNGYKYRCIVNNICGTGVNSNAATLTVNSIVATEATNLTSSSFTANWNIVPGAISYSLDVSTSIDFSSFITGYSNLNVNNVNTFIVSGLNFSTTYYYRVRVLYSCGVSENSNTITVSTSDLTIGSSYGGGIVFYIDGTGQHGLIATQGDLSPSIFWHETSSGVTGATGISVGTGNSNTNAIVALYDSEINAARICYDFVSGGYSDWFLPSKNELNLMFLNKNIIGGFADDVYWSSSESNDSWAWQQSFSTGGFQSTGAKLGTKYVRAVRAF